MTVLLHFLSLYLTIIVNISCCSLKHTVVVTVTQVSQTGQAVDIVQVERTKRKQCPYEFLLCPIIRLGNPHRPSTEVNLMVSGSWGPVDHEKMMAVTGETCLHSNTDKSTLLEYFQFLATDHGQCLHQCCFCCHGLLKSLAAIPAACIRFGNRKLHYAGLRFISWQEHLFPACFGTVSITSFLFHFVLTENSLKIISTQLLEEKW